MRSKKALKNTIFSILQKIVAIICGFIVPHIIISNFGSNVNGLVSSISQFLGYITLLESGFGPVVAATLYKPLANNDKQTVINIVKSAEIFFRKIACVFLIYIAILFFAYPTIINKDFNFLFTSSLILIISCSIFAEYYFGMANSLLIKAKQDSRIVSIIQIATTILNTILVIVLVKSGASIHVVKLGSAVVFIIRPLIQNMYVRKKYKYILADGDKNYKIKNKWDGLAQHIAAVVHSNTDITVLTLFSTLTEVSVYSVYYLVVNGIKNMISSFSGGVDASFGDMIAKNEITNLNKKFKFYELCYFTLITIVYACALTLIIPFVKVYTNGIIDVNYVRPLFGILIVLSEFFHSIRAPYSSITLAAGHFRETMMGAWFEALINIVISIILVSNFGIIGVAIGTLVAMIIRTIEFVYHSSKYILKRPIFEFIKRFLVIIIEVLLLYFINIHIINLMTIQSYMEFIIAAIIIFIISTITILTINYIFYKDDFKGVKKMIIKMVKIGGSDSN